MKKRRTIFLYYVAKKYLQISYLLCLFHQILKSGLTTNLIINVLVRFLKWSSIPFPRNHTTEGGYNKKQ